MNVIAADISEVLVFEPKVFHDERGFFLESYNKRTAADAGLNCEFVQENHSHSLQKVLRGLHYQIGRPQGKLVRVVSGVIWDVAVDIRRNSPSFGRWVAAEISAENKKVVWVPEGFAHGFLVLSEIADVLYKTTDYYSPHDERSILWNDPQLAIPWPTDGDVILSAKDRAASHLRYAELFE
jgi:dTDP-4-dehydrorhamnose 3,5-epimerase